MSTRISKRVRFCLRCDADISKRHSLALMCLPCSYIRNAALAKKYRQTPAKEPAAA